MTVTNVVSELLTVEVELVSLLRVRMVAPTSPLLMGVTGVFEDSWTVGADSPGVSEGEVLGDELDSGAGDAAIVELEDDEIGCVVGLSGAVSDVGGVDAEAGAVSVEDDVEEEGGVEEAGGGGPEDPADEGVPEGMTDGELGAAAVETELSVGLGFTDSELGEELEGAAEGIGVLVDVDELAVTDSEPEATAGGMEVWVEVVLVGEFEGDTEAMEVPGAGVVDVGEETGVGVEVSVLILVTLSAGATAVVEVELDAGMLDPWLVLGV